MAAALHKPIELIEVSPRDGLQNERTPLPTAQKLELVTQLIGAGLRRIEVTSFVRADRIPQLADAEALCAALPERDDVRYSALVLNDRGLDRALATQRLHEVGCVLCTTDTFGQRNQGQSVPEGLVAVRAICKRARASGLGCSVTLAVAFGCPYEGRQRLQRVAELAQRVAEAGPTEIVLADTIGVAVPADVQGLLGVLRAKLGTSSTFRGHFHNTRNMAVANVVAALSCGVTRFDASLGGIGGCPYSPKSTGNVATEDLQYLFEQSGHPTGVDLRALIAVARWLGSAAALGHELPGALSKAGPYPA